MVKEAVHYAARLAARDASTRRQVVHLALMYRTREVAACLHYWRQYNGAYVIAAAWHHWRCGRENARAAGAGPFNSFAGELARQRRIHTNYMTIGGVGGFFRQLTFGAESNATRSVLCCKKCENSMKSWSYGLRQIQRKEILDAVEGWSV